MTKQKVNNARHIKQNIQATACYDQQNNKYFCTALFYILLFRSKYL